MPGDRHVARTTISIAAHTVGRRSKRIEPHPIEVPAFAPHATLAMLIDAVVAAEVAAFEARRDEAGVLRFITDAELTERADTGRIRFDDWSSERPHDPIDVDAAQQRARLAFTDGLFKVMIDRSEVTDLDHPVTIREGTDVLFVRLVALAGG